MYFCQTCSVWPVRWIFLKRWSNTENMSLQAFNPRCAFLHLCPLCKKNSNPRKSLFRYLLQNLDPFQEILEVKAVPAQILFTDFGHLFQTLKSYQCAGLYSGRIDDLILCLCPNLDKFAIPDSLSHETFRRPYCRRFQYFFDLCWFLSCKNLA